MKLHFEPNLDYQKAAIESVADLFRGQEINRTEFTVTRRPMAERAGQADLDLGGFLGAARRIRAGRKRTRHRQPADAA